MNLFTIYELRESAIQYLFTIRDEIDFNPIYQRIGDVWTPGKKQLLLDSIINGYDIPKIYFHEKENVLTDDLPFAIVDGKQRLRAIFDFMNGKLALSDEIEYLKDSSVTLKGLTYREFGDKYPKLKSKFDATIMPVIIIKTGDIDFIEDMFYRLNEASPLNAAEKRNAYPGPLPGLIRKVVGHHFFQKKVSFSESRYRFHDVATKLMYLCHTNKISDTKKIHLDSFVKRNDVNTDTIYSKISSVLAGLCDTFVDKDELLGKIGLIPVYFIISLIKGSQSGMYSLDRQKIFQFYELLRNNREYMNDEEQQINVDYELVEFDRLTQTPNDSYSIEFKIKIMSKYILNESDVVLINNKLESFVADNNL
jgi:hypothetical protein